MGADASGRKATQVEELQSRIGLLVRSGYTGLALLSSEEDRCADILERVALDLGRKVYVWSMTQGWTYRGTIIGLADEAPMLEGDEDIKRMQAPVDALDAILRHACGRPLILILKDIAGYFNEPKVLRKMADVMSGGQPWTIAFVTPKTGLPPALEKDIALVEVPLPD